MVDKPKICTVVVKHCSILSQHIGKPLHSLGRDTCGAGALQGAGTTRALRHVNPISASNAGILLEHPQPSDYASEMLAAAAAAAAVPAALFCDFLAVGV